jgi:hypothetical protein
MADKKIALELEVNIKKGDMTLGELNSQLENLGGTIQEQKDILIEFERELLELQAIQSQTAKNDFARQTQLKEKSDELKGAIKDQRLSIRELSNEQANASTAVKELTKESADQSKVIQALDKVTGGAATKVIKLYKGFQEGSKAVKTFVSGLGNVGKALIATGIGAFVVALGLVVAYWEEINDLIDGGSKKLKDQVDLSEQKLERSADELKLLELQEAILEEQGLSTAEIVKQKRLIIEESKEENRLLLENLKLQREKVLAQALEGSTLDKIVETLSGARGFRLGKLTGGIEDSFKEVQDRITESEEKALQFELSLAKIDSAEAKKVDDAKKKREKESSDKNKADEKALAEKARKNKEEERLEKEKQKALEDIRKGLIDTDAERRQEELNAIDRHYEELIKLAEKYGKDTEALNEARDMVKQEFFDKEKERDKKKEKEDSAKLLKEQEDLIKSLEYKQEQDENDFELRRAEVARREALLLADDTLTKDQRLLLERQFAAESKKIDEDQNANRRELANQRLQIAGDILGAINGLAQAFAKDDEESQKKAFKLNKAAGIGQAIISTAVGINNAYMNPADVASGVAFLKAGLIASSGIAQIATIKKTEFQGGTQAATPPPTLGSGGAGAAPIGFTQNLNNTQIPTTKVIVTETDIRRATRNIDGIYNKAVVVE